MNIQGLSFTFILTLHIMLVYDTKSYRIVNMLHLLLFYFDQIVSMDPSGINSHTIIIFKDLLLLSGRHRICQQNLCRQCKEEHVISLDTLHHNVTIYRGKYTNGLLSIAPHLLGISLSECIDLGIIEAKLAG